MSDSRLYQICFNGGTSPSHLQQGFWIMPFSMWDNHPHTEAGASESHC